MIPKVTGELREDLRQKLTELQERMVEERGVVDMKMTLREGTDPHDINAVAEDTIHILQSMLDGNVRKLPPIGDSHLSKRS